MHDTRSPLVGDEIPGLVGSHAWLLCIISEAQGLQITCAWACHAWPIAPESCKEQDANALWNSYACSTAVGCQNQAAKFENEWRQWEAGQYSPTSSYITPVQGALIMAGSMADSAFLLLPFCAFLLLPFCVHSFFFLSVHSFYFLSVHPFFFVSLCLMHDAFDACNAK